MIIALAYLMVITYLIYKNGFFGVFSDEHISRKKYALLFLVKCIAIPVFYYIYELYYGGIKNYDGGIFLKDAGVLHQLAKDKPSEYFKLLFGFQDDAEGSYLYNHYLIHTNNWDNGSASRLFFNDNRTVLRLHSLVYFISFGNYFVHALFSCFLSFTGIHFFYKCFKNLLPRNKHWAIYPFVFLPNLWLFTGALLKEPILVFTCGLGFYLLYKLENEHISFRKRIFFVLVLIPCALLVKAPVAVFLMYMYYLFLKAGSIRKPLWSVFYFLSGLILIFVITNLTSLAVKGKGMFAFMELRQKEFYDMMKGGIFLKDNEKFIRLAYDYALINADSSTTQPTYSIKKGVSYTYWLHASQKDTLICPYNTDTLSLYELVYTIVPAKSFYEIKTPNGFNLHSIKQITKAVFYGIIYPISFNSLLKALVSIENILLCLALVLCVSGLFNNKIQLSALFFISVFIVLIIVFALTSPNTGALVRYRCLPASLLVLGGIICFLNKFKNKC